MTSPGAAAPGWAGPITAHERINARIETTPIEDRVPIDAPDLVEDIREERVPRDVDPVTGREEHVIDGALGVVVEQDTTTAAVRRHRADSPACGDRDSARPRAQPAGAGWGDR